MVAFIGLITAAIGYVFLISPKNPDNQKTQFDHLQSIINRLDKDVSDLKQEVDELKKEKDELELEKDQLESDYQALEIAYERQLEKNRELEQRIEKLELELKEKKNHEIK